MALNGIEAAGEIRKRLGVPSIFVTAYADVQTRVSVEQVRAVELLAKPVSQAALQAALQKAQRRVKGTKAPD
jgi:CheY-like chemotaxis protein